MEFSSKVALITGGAGGIGQALGKEFLERGAKVCLCDINEITGREIVSKFQNEFGENNVIFVKCDVTSKEDFEAAYEECEAELGSLNILCNNAGILINDNKISFSINYEGVVAGTELALKRMGKQNGGNGGIVVNTGSIVGAMDMPFAPYYAASKAAVIHYSRCIGNELHYTYSGVSVLCICPNAVDTNLLEDSTVKGGSYCSQVEELFEKFVQELPKLRPEEVAAAIVQLINENKTGKSLVVEKDISPYYLAPAIVKDI